MKPGQAKSVGDIINEILQQERLDVPLDEHRASALWPEIVGYGVNKYTTRRYVHSGVMHVTISSAPLRNELNLNRSAIVSRINEALGRDVIKEIVFH